MWEPLIVESGAPEAAQAQGQALAPPSALDTAAAPLRAPDADGSVIWEEVVPATLGAQHLFRDFALKRPEGLHWISGCVGEIEWQISARASRGGPELGAGRGVWVEGGISREAVENGHERNMAIKSEVNESVVDRDEV